MGTQETQTQTLLIFRTPTCFFFGSGLSYQSLLKPETRKAELEGGSVSQSAL